MGERGGSFWQALFQELRRLGYEEGRNLKVERYSAEGQHEIYPELAKQVVATQPDLVFSAGRLVAVIAEAAAGRVPIVGFMDDPVALGLSTSLCVPSPAQELEYRRVFANLDHDRPDFVNVTTAGENFTHREPIVGAVNEMRIPALHP